MSSPPMLAARASLGSAADKMHWTSIDLGPLVVGALQNKHMDWAMDQQEWLEGYLPVQQLVFYLRYSFVPARSFTPVGPAFITPATVGKYVNLSAQGYR